MTTWIRWIVAVVLALTFDASIARAQEGPSLDDEYADAVVLIEVFPGTGETSIPMGFGTGWLASYDGYVITAEHVVTADGDLPWGQARLEGRIGGRRAEPLTFVARLDGDLALLRFEWGAKRQADATFDRVRDDAPLTRAQVWVFGYSSTRDTRPSVRSHVISVSGSRLAGDGRLPHGMSGAPVLVIDPQHVDVVAMALAIVKNGQGGDVEAEYISAAKMRAAFRELDNRQAVLTRPHPLWLPHRSGASLFREGDAKRVVHALLDGGTVFVSGGPGTELEEFAVDTGDRLWQRVRMRNSHFVYVDASEQDLSGVLNLLVERLQRKYLTRATNEEKIQEIRTLLDRAERRVLIVHGVVSDDIVKTLLQIRGRTPLMVTSVHHRDAPAGAQFTVALRLGGLPREECVALVRAESGGFDTDTAGHVGSACDALGGLPAVARMVGVLLRQNVAIGDILEMIKIDPAALDVERRLAPLYERIVKSLHDDAQRLAMSLSVIGGESFDKEAARSVSGLPGAKLLLPRLFKVNLVEAVGDRYRIAPITRAYLSGRLQALPDQYARARGALLTHYLENFHGGPADYRAEWSNIQHALKVASELPDATERRRWLAAAVPRLVPIMRSWGRWAEHDRWVRRWLASLDDRDVDGRLDALGTLTESAVEQGRDADARTLIARAQQIPDASSRPAAAWIFGTLARLDVEPVVPGTPLEPARMARAHANITTFLSLAEKTVNPVARAAAQAAGFRRRGILLQIEGRLDEAGAAFKKSLALATDGGSREQRVRTLYHLGQLDTYTNAWEEAARKLAIVVEEAEEVDAGVSANAFYMLGRVAREQRNLPAAERYFSEAVKRYELSGSRYVSAAHEQLAQVRRELQGDPPPAVP